MQDLRSAVGLATERAGGGAKLARGLGLKRQAIYQWDKVPAERVLEVERITGVPRSQLRPDLYPEHREPQPEQAAS